MQAARHSKLLHQVLNDKNVSNLSAETPERQLEMYRLVLEKIKEQVNQHVPREVPLDTLKEDEEALDELSKAFAHLSSKPSLAVYKIKKEVLPFVEQALDQVGRAIDAREKARTKKQAKLPSGYQRNVIRFRSLVIQLCDYLQPPP